LQAEIRWRLTLVQSRLTSQPNARDGTAARVVFRNPSVTRSGGAGKRHPTAAVIVKSVEL
jgi:hypothetical protein